MAEQPFIRIVRREENEALPEFSIDPRTPAQKVLDSTLAFAGNVGGAVLGAGAVHRVLSKQTARKLLTPGSDIHTRRSSPMDEELDMFERIVRDNDPRQNGSAQLMDQVAEIRQSPRYQASVKTLESTPEFQAISDAQQAIAHLKRAPENNRVAEVNFIEHEGRPAAEVVLYNRQPYSYVNEAGELANGLTHAGRVHRVMDVVPPEGMTFLKENGVRSLMPHEIDGLAHSPWLKEIEAVVTRAHQAHFEEHFEQYVEALRKATPLSFSFQTMSLLQKGAVAGVALVGAAVGDSVVRAITQHVRAKKAPPITPELLAEISAQIPPFTAPGRG